MSVRAPPGGRRWNCQQSETAGRCWLDYCCCFEWKNDLDSDSLSSPGDTTHSFLWEEHHVWILHRADGKDTPLSSCTLKTTEIKKLLFFNELLFKWTRFANNVLVMTKGLTDVKQDAVATPLQGWGRCPAPCIWTCLRTWWEAGMDSPADLHKQNCHSTLGKGVDFTIWDI